MPAVSVIVLVYKVEKYIEQCARALFEQTLEDLEYVFVDDCTPDASMDILERVLADYPARRSQVKILHNEVNRGQAYSRRRGVEAATGDYIIHCDSDDWPEPEMYAKMYFKAANEKLDLVICSVRRVFPNHAETVACLKQTSDLINSLLSQDILNYLHNKLIVRHAYENSLTWPIKNMCEDTALIIQLAYYCHRWGIINEDLYNYRFVEDSISTSQMTLDRMEQIRANIDLAIAFLDSKGLRKRYRRAISHLKCWTKPLAISLPYKYYVNLYPEVNFLAFFDRRLTLTEHLGHFTKMLGIHGVSKFFSRMK